MIYAKAILNWYKMKNIIEKIVYFLELNKNAIICKMFHRKGEGGASDSR